MFITSAGFEQWMPEGLWEKGTKFWQVVQLSTAMPWYLLHLSVHDGRESCVESFAVAWETALLALLKASPMPDVHALQMFVRARDGSASWTSREISEVWTPAADEHVDTGPLLFRFGDETNLTSCLLQPLGGRAGRELVIRLRAR